MQGFSILTLPNGKKVSVMVRQGKTARYISITHREVKPKNIGVSLSDEEFFLKDNPAMVKKLLDGKTIIL